MLSGQCDQIPKTVNLQLVGWWGAEESPHGRLYYGYARRLLDIVVREGSFVREGGVLGTETPLPPSYQRQSGGSGVSQGGAAVFRKSKSGSCARGCEMQKF